MSSPYAPAHGTRARYLTEACRCDPCRAANAEEGRRRRRALAEGRPALVDATPVREHLAALRATGFGVRRIAAASGVAQETIDGIFGIRGRPATVRVRPETAAALLAVDGTTPPGIAERVPVPSLGTLRRLRSLTAAGYSLAAIARDAGLTPEPLGRILRSARTTVGSITHDRIKVTFDRLPAGGPTPRTTHEASVIAARRDRANAAGWPMPAAWDNPDDPTEVRTARRKAP